MRKLRRLDDDHERIFVHQARAELLGSIPEWVGGSGEGEDIE